MSLKKPSLRPGSAWLFTTGLGRLQALSLGRHITSLVFFQIGTQKLTIKEPAKKQAHVQILAGGLEDSDAEAVNPFPLLSKLGPHTLTEEELTKRSQQVRQNPSHQNKASTFFHFLMKILMQIQYSLFLLLQVIKRMDMPLTQV